MDPRVPRRLIVIRAGELLRQAIHAGLVSGGEQERVRFLLEGFVRGISANRAVVEINFVSPRVGEAFGHVLQHDPVPDDPVRGHTSGPAKDVRVLAQGVEGDQPAHARTHHKRVGLRGQGAVSGVHKGLEFFHQETEIVIGEERSRLLDELCDGDRVGEVRGFLRHKFCPAFGRMTPHRHDDGLPHGVVGDETGHHLIHAPRDFVGRGFGVEDVLPVVHVKHGVAAVPSSLVTGREPDFDLARINKLGGEGRVKVDGHLCVVRAWKFRHKGSAD